jgi:hypothetical protein
LSTWYVPSDAHRSCHFFSIAWASYGSATMAGDAMFSHPMGL